MKSATKMGVVAVAALAVAACQQATEPTSDLGARPSFAHSSSPHPTAEAIDLCKIGPAGTYNFDVSGTSPKVSAGNLNLNAGVCTRIAYGGGLPFSATVQENVPSGFVLDSITVDQLAPDGSVTHTLIEGTSVASAYAGGQAFDGTPNRGSGAVITYFNSAERPPPPPPGGGEGCTPGYWGRPQHFDSWTSPYTTSTTFQSVFGVNAYPGMTLLQVVNNPGPPKQQLGRMAVAALLNAASPGVDFDLTTAEVIAAFNAAWASGEYNETKNMLDRLNNQGCPLN